MGCEWHNKNNRPCLIFNKFCKKETATGVKKYCRLFQSLCTFSYANRANFNLLFSMLNNTIMKRDR